MTQYLCMPADFSLETLAEYSRLNQQYKHLQVYETYGALNPSPMNAGRNRISPWLPLIDLPGLRRYIEAGEAQGIRFNYTFNASCSGGREFTARGRREIVGFIGKLREYGVKSITVVAPSLIQIIKAEFPDMHVSTSTIMEIETVAAAEAFAGFGADRIILAEDVQRRFDTIRRIRKAVDRPLEVLTNTACLFQCPWRKSHYNLLSHTRGNHELDIEAYYHWQCMALRATRPIELLKLRWIRPEDLHLYSDATFFKVVGRYFAHQSDLVRVARIYMEGRFEGNLWDLFGNFAPQRRHGFYIDNRSLDGFVDWFAANKKHCKHLSCDDCSHCSDYAARAVRLTPTDTGEDPLGIRELRERLSEFHACGTHIQRVSELDALWETEG